MARGWRYAQPSLACALFVIARVRVCATYPRYFTLYELPPRLSILPILFGIFLLFLLVFVFFLFVGFALFSFLCSR